MNTEPETPETPEEHPEKTPTESLAEGISFVVNMMNEGNIDPDLVYPSRGSGSRYYGD